MTQIFTGVERIVVPSKREQRLAFLAESARQGNEIARKRNAKTAANRKKYAKRKNR
jgi:hypothetical protein